MPRLCAGMVEVEVDWFAGGEEETLLEEVERDVNISTKEDRRRRCGGGEAGGGSDMSAESVGVSWVCRKLVYEQADLDSEIEGYRSGQSTLSVRDRELAVCV